MRTSLRALLVLVALVFALGGCNEKQRRETRNTVRGSGSTNPNDASTDPNGDANGADPNGR